MKRAFTLIELLVVIAIIALLVGILLPALVSARRQGRVVRELAAIRTLQGAHTEYAVDNRDVFLPGSYDFFDAFSGRASAVDEFGNQVDGLTAGRWIYHLAPYFDYQWNGVTHVNDQADFLGDRDTFVRNQGAVEWSYRVSLNPSFGYNTYFVGGQLSDGQAAALDLAVTRLDQALRPDHLISFASALGQEQGSGVLVRGNLRVELPPLGATVLEEPEIPDAQGNLDPRARSGFITAHLDGHAGITANTDAVDATRWSDTAARLGDPDWRPPLIQYTNGR